MLQAWRSHNAEEGGATETDQTRGFILSLSKDEARWKTRWTPESSPGVTA